MNILKQILAYFFPPLPPPMPRACHRSQATFSSCHQNNRPACAISKCLPSRPANRNVSTLPSCSEGSPLDFELGENSRRAKEYELENPNAVRQEIQRKVQHILVKRVGRPKKKKSPVINVCTCDTYPSCSAQERAKDGIQNKIREVYVPSPCQRTDHERYPSLGDCGSKSDRCSCSITSASARSRSAARSRSKKRTPSSSSFSDNSSSSNICLRSSSAKTYLKYDEGICLNTPILIRTSSPKRGKKAGTCSTKKNMSYSANTRQSCRRIPKKRKSKNLTTGASFRKRAKSR